MKRAGRAMISLLVAAAAVALIVALPWFLPRAMRQRALSPAEAQRLGLECANDVIRRFEDFSNRDVERRYREALETFATLDENALPGIEKVVEHPDVLVRRSLGDIVFHMAYPSYSYKQVVNGAGLPEPRQMPWLRPVLEKAYESDSPRTRGLAVGLMSAFVGESTAFFVKATRDEAFYIRRHAFVGLAQTQTKSAPEVAEAILRGLSEEEATVRAAAVVAAGAIRVDAALPSLLDLLKDDTVLAGPGHPYMPWELLKTIWRDYPITNDHPGIDYEPRIKDLAVYAIQRCAGKDFGFVACYESRNDMDQIIQRIRRASDVTGKDNVPGENADE